MADKALQSLSLPGLNDTYVNTPLSTAPTFVTTQNYAVDDCVFYNRKLYKFVTAHSAGAWDNSHVQEITIADELSDVRSDLTHLESSVESAPKVSDPEESDADLYICDNSGNVIGKFEGGHIITKNFDSSDVGDLSDLTTTAKQNLVEAINEAAESGGSTTDIIMETPETTADLYICDSFGNVVAELKNGHIATKNFDSSDYDDVLSDIDTLKTNVSTIEAATSGILYRNKDSIDGVYAACRWHQPTITSKQFCMLIAGDIHSDAVRMNNIIDYLNGVDAFDCGIMLGDIAGSTFDGDVTFYTNSISQATKPFLTALGNHDVSGSTSTSSVYDKFIAPNIQYADLASGEFTSGNCYYYKDFPAYGIRIIVMNQYDYPTDPSYERENVCYSQAQIDWLIATLSNTPSDYGVIICGHTHFGKPTVETDHILTAPKRNGDPSSPPKLMDKFVVPEIVNAWINGTTLSETVTYTPGGAWSTATVTADFTSRGTGEFITYLGGHWHMTSLSHMTDYTDQKEYHVDCANMIWSLQGDTPRRYGTKSEDCFCAFAVDRDNRKVKIFRIGAHFSYQAIDRLYGIYAY